MYDDFLPFEVRSAIVAHMQAHPTDEVCGVIEKTKTGYTYVECDNVSTDGLMDRFKFDHKTSLRIHKKGSPVVAYVHSHPDGPLWPSVLDQQMQIEVNKPSVIVGRDNVSGMIEVFSFGDHLLEAPLIGRIFKHAVFDCWEAIRSWKFQEEGEYLERFPRDALWWSVEENNSDMYSANFASQGYAEFQPDFDNPLSPSHPQRGDVILMQLDAPVINHAAVYVGNNQIYHHRVNKKSGETALGYLMDTGYVRKWLRREEIDE